MRHTDLFAGMGPNLARFEVDAERFELTRRESLALPANVHAICGHRSRPLAYVATSDRLSIQEPGKDHHVCVLRRDSRLGAWELAETMALSHRPIHLATDLDSRHLLVAFDTPSEVQVFRLKEDGMPGDRVPQRDGMDWGRFVHHVRVAGDNRLLTVATRGVPFRGDKSHEQRQSEPGAVKVFRYEDGRLGEGGTITIGDGYHFGARCVDFHPTQPWVFVSVETQNQLYVFRREGDHILPEPLYVRNILASPDHVPCLQIACELYVHPSGRFVYCVNRGHLPFSEYQGKKVLVGADNTFAVFAINQATGEPTLIQQVDAGGVYPRTFGLHPSGKLLVSCNSEARVVRNGDELQSFSPNLALFEIGNDGTLKLAKRYDFEPEPKRKLWMSMVSYE